MNTYNPTLTAYFNYIGGISLPLNVVNACSHSGNCDDDIERNLELPEVAKEMAKIDPDQLVKELREYGAWDDNQLKDHKANLSRILWIAAGNIQDELIWELKHKGEFIFEGTENECYIKLQRVQSQSADWAIKYEGYTITIKNNEDGN